MPKSGYLTASCFPELMQSGKNGAEFGLKAMAHIERLAMDMLNVTRPDEITSYSY